MSPFIAGVRRRGLALSIGQRLYLSFAILLVFQALVGGAAYFTENNVNNQIARVTGTSMTIRDLAGEIDNHLTVTRLNFEEFLHEMSRGTDYDTAYAMTIAPALDNLAHITEDSAQLRTLTSGSDEAHLATVPATLDQLGQTTQAIQEGIQHLATDQQTLGNNDEVGLVGTLFGHLGALVTQAEGTGMAENKAAVLNMSEQAALFLFDHDPAHGTQFHDAADSLKTTIQTLEVSTTQRNDFLAKIDEATADFDNLVAVRTEMTAEIQAFDDTVAASAPLIDALHTVADQEMNEALTAIAETQNLALTIQVIIFGLTIFIGAGLALVIVRGITGPLARFVQITGQIAAGDLSQRVNLNSRDEIGILAAAFDKMVARLDETMNTLMGHRTYLESAISQYRQIITRVADGDLTTTANLQAKGDDTQLESEDVYDLGVNLNMMVERLATMTHQVREATAAVAAAATEIQAATTQQTASSTEQDTAVTQTVTTVQEVRETVAQTAERAQGVAEAARQSVNVSRQGQEAVLDSIDGMQVIQKRVADIATTILALSERTQQISEIIDTVNAIADQSKLLALNASIEAARAGEEGRGFAVVAMEVRQLAEQSREATGRVQSILSEIQDATNTAVMVTEEGSKGAEKGMALVERAGQAIRDLANTMEDAMQAATQIAASTHQQANGMDQLVAAMAQIQQASQQAAASTRQTEQSVVNIGEMAAQLEEAMARYQLAE